MRSALTALALLCLTSTAALAQDAAPPSSAPPAADAPTDAAKPAEAAPAPAADAAPPAADAAPPAAEPAPAPATEAAPSAAEAGPRAVRKERFQAHRSLGFAVEALMLAATGFYIADDVDRFGPGARSGAFAVPTLGLTSAAEVGMVVNLLLALTAPPRAGAAPVKNLVHQIFVYAGAAANVAKLVVGILLAGATSLSGNEGLVTAYRITSIAAPVLFATGMTIQFF